MESERRIFVPHSFNKAHQDQSPDMPEFFSHGRHVFIMTNAGRPVYVRYGDEIKTAIFLATMNAIVQKYLIFFSTDKTPQQLFKVIHHNLAIYFLQRKQMTLFCTTKNLNDSEYLIFQMLEFLNSQLISSVTDQVNIQLETRPNYDPRALLSGSKNILTLAVKNAINSPCVIFNSIAPLPMNSQLRSQIHSILKEQKNNSLLATILMTETMIVDLVKKKDNDMKVDDILLVQNLIQGQSQLRKSENWIPICLPGLSALGMVQAYIYFFQQNLAIFMISDDNSMDMFLQLKEASKEIIDKLETTNLSAQIQKYLDNSPMIPHSLEQPSTIRHFIVKHQSGQIFLPQYAPFGRQPKEFKKLLHLYGEKYKEFLTNTQNLTQAPTKENYFSWSSDGIGISQYHETLIIFSFDRLIDLQQVSTNVHVLQKMMKSDELGTYFILKQY